MTSAKTAPPPAAALWSAPGVGALAAVRAVGVGSGEALSSRFLPASPQRWAAALEKSSREVADRIFFGRWRLPGGGQEEVVLRQAGVDVWEIVCHGGERVAAAVLESLERDGFVLVPPEEVAAVPELLGRDALQQAAFDDLPSARTERAALGLLAQYQGALSRELLETEARLAAGDSLTASERLRVLLLRSRGGRAWLNPLRIVLAGAPNVGKSSLLNALLGYERAITSPTPGTTRDVVSDGAAFDGWPVELRDTAGLRESSDPLEAAGVEASRGQIVAADLVLWVRDATRPDLPPPEEFSSDEGDFPRRILAVWNKVDRASPPSADPAAVAVSATTREGIDELVARIVHSLFAADERFGPADAAPWRAEHVSSLETALALCEAGNLAAAAEVLRRLRVGT